MNQTIEGKFEKQGNPKRRIKYIATHSTDRQNSCFHIIIYTHINAFTM